METFNFPNHTMRHKYPDGDRVRFGRGYTFAARPVTPIQRSFTLSFNSLRWEWDEEEEEYSATISPTTNMLALANFYEVHLLDKRFIYPHPVYGNLTVRFDQPFELPKSLPGGSGWTEPFDLVVIEEPA